MQTILARGVGWDYWTLLRVTMSTRRIPGIYCILADIKLNSISRVRQVTARRSVKYLSACIANIITFVLAGVYLTDTQSGLKALSRKALEKICITANGYEFCSEIIREAKYYKLDIIEIPVSVIYTPYSLSKGQNLSTGLTTVFKLIVRTLMR